MVYCQVVMNTKEIIEKSSEKAYDFLVKKGRVMGVNEVLCYLSLHLHCLHLHPLHLPHHHPQPQQISLTGTLSFPGHTACDPH